jgi:rhodanese-related sulfurtransferase
LIPQLSPAELQQWRADASREAPLLIDVRERWEFDYCRIDGAVSLPLSEFARRYTELPRDRPLVLVCHHGRRSQHAAMLLEGAGFERLHNLHGGVALWADTVEPTMKRY